MEINKDNIAEVFASDEYKNDILPLITASDAVQTIIGNKAKVISDENIDDRVSKTHARYDDDMFEVLGIRPGQDDKGSKIKTYKFIKDVLYPELKGLREQKDSLTKDKEVIRLNGEIETLKKDGGGSHIQAILDKATETWNDKEKVYLKQISDAGNNNETFQKKTAIASAMQQIKFNPDTSESIKKMVLDNVEADLIKNSKFEDGKLIFTDADGKPVINKETYKPKDALEMLNSIDAVKSISLKEGKKGGNAKPEISGSIQTLNVEGKDTKKLVLTEGSFKTKDEFQKVAQKAMLDSGVARRSQDWQPLIDKAFIEYKVADMPIQ